MPDLEALQVENQVLRAAVEQALGHLLYDGWTDAFARLMAKNILAGIALPAADEQPEAALR